MAPVQRHMILLHRRCEKGNLPSNKRLLTFAAPPPNARKIVPGVTQLHAGHGSVAWEPGKSALNIGHRAYEIFALSRLRRDVSATSAQRRARADLDLPANAVAAGRLQLPSSADLFSLWRRGDRAFWALGWRLDDAGAAAALPAVGYFGNRQCAADPATGRVLVFAVALRPMARR